MSYDDTAHVLDEIECKLREVARTLLALEAKIAALGGPGIVKVSRSEQTFLAEEVARDSSFLREPLHVLRVVTDSTTDAGL